MEIAGEVSVGFEGLTGQASQYFSRQNLREFVWVITELTNSNWQAISPIWPRVLYCWFPDVYFGEQCRMFLSKAVDKKTTASYLLTPNAMICLSL